MTTTEFRTLLTQALRNLDPKSDSVEVFRAAFTYRRQQSDSVETGPRGLVWALERAFSLYSGRTVPVAGLPREPLDDTFLASLVDAAERVPDSVYARLLRRLENEGVIQTGTVDAMKVVSEALAEYAKYADEGLTPGP